MQRHIKKKVKNEVIETPLSDANQMIGTQANPLDLKFGASSQQTQGEEAKPSQPRHRLPTKRKDHPPSSKFQPPSSTKMPRTQPSFDHKKRKSLDSDSYHAPKPKKPTIRIKPSQSLTTHISLSSSSQPVQNPEPSQPTPATPSSEVEIL